MKVQSFKGFKCRALISATATMDDKEVTTWRGKTEVSEETRTEIISCVVLWMRGELGESNYCGQGNIAHSGRVEECRNVSFLPKRTTLLVAIVYPIPPGPHFAPIGMEGKTKRTITALEVEFYFANF